MQAPYELPPPALLPEASGVDGPTQAALLLRRRKDARALDAELARTLSETAAGAALQDAREASIQGRVAELAATEARWKPFIQETSSKEAKAVRRAQAEAAAAAQQAVESAAVAAELARVQASCATAQRRLARLAQVDAFFQRVREAAEAGIVERFEDVQELMSR